MTTYIMTTCIMTDAEHIIEVARTYMGVPYLHQGRNRAGLDCIGLIVCVARDLGMDVQDMDRYTTDPEPEKLMAGLAGHLQEIPIGEAAIGDVGLFRVKVIPQHTAILTDVGMIHAYSSPSANRVVEHGISNWAERMVAAYRFPVRKESR